MKKDCLIKYDDDLKLFLTKSLSKIDYLRNATPEILLSLAFACEAEIKEASYLLYDMEQEYINQINDEMIIVFDGCIELYMVMDAGTQLPVERLTAGSILNPHNMLS